ncbi:MAG: hypothetical protein EOM05_03190 [Clostridia bacterium]|nr:hypothetical protein [Clostridia bacterium]
MTLYEMGTQYVEQSKEIRSQIRELRPQLKALSGYELLELRRKLACLYQMSLDCRRIGEHLQNYYN